MSRGKRELGDHSVAETRACHRELDYVVHSRRRGECSGVPPAEFAIMAMGDVSVLLIIGCGTSCAQLTGTESAVTAPATVRYTERARVIRHGENKKADGRPRLAGASLS